MLQHIAMVPGTEHLDMSELPQVSAAIQQQLARHVSPIWQLNATVSAYQHLQDVPQGYWIVLITDKDLGRGIEGFHEDEHGQPFALVRYEPDWSAAASHEIIEMMIDPFGK